MSAYKNGVMTIYLAKWKLLRTSDARGKSRSPVFMYLGPCAIQNFMATHTEVVEIFQSGFKVVLVVQHCNSYSHVTIMAVWLELGVVITLTSQNCRWLDALANACHSGSLPLWATSLHYFTTLWRRGVGKVRRGKWVCIKSLLLLFWTWLLSILSRGSHWEWSRLNNDRKLLCLI